MIELNLTYEQSKKIFELGYDFTPICRDFELHEEEKITKFVLVERYDDGVVTLYDCSEHESYIYSTKSWWITPIIPKAALEACLPNLYTESEYSGDVKFFTLTKRSGHTFWWVSSDDECLETFPHSAYEAFIWCHEKYPEELRNKFEEVMK